MTLCPHPLKAYGQLVHSQQPDLMPLKGRAETPGAWGWGGVRPGLGRAWELGRLSP